MLISAFVPYPDESTGYVITRPMKELSPILIVSWIDPRLELPSFQLPVPGDL